MRTVKGKAVQKQALKRLGLKVKRQSSGTQRLYVVLRDGTIQFQ